MTQENDASSAMCRVIFEQIKEAHAALAAVKIEFERSALRRAPDFPHPPPLDEEVERLEYVSRCSVAEVTARLHAIEALVIKLNF